MLDDALTEGDERFFVSVSSTNQNVKIVNGTATITIVDNDGMLNTKYIQIRTICNGIINIKGPEIRRNVLRKNFMPCNIYNLLYKTLVELIQPRPQAL